MSLETPDELAARSKLSREEFCQRLVTTLILGGPYPKWNTRSTPSAVGLRFLRALYEQSIALPWPGDDLLFVDEFSLPKLDDPNGYRSPDWAALWTDRLWMIELKTEASSHWKGQIPTYFALATHHYPDHEIALTYLTPAGTRAAQPPPESTYAHIEWGDVVPSVRSLWGDSEDESVRAVARGVADILDHLDVPTSRWREHAGLPEPVPSATGAIPDAMDVGMDAAGLTAQDGRQRGVEVDVHDLEELEALRVELRDAIATTEPGSPLRHVRPWLWQASTSGGQPLTFGGAEHGIELRLSRYDRSLG